MKRMSKRDDRGITARLVALLGAFADGRASMAVSQLAEQLRLPPSTVHRLLEQLVELDMIERASHRRYRIGPEFFRMSARVQNRFRMVDIAQPLMQELADEIGGVCVLSTLIKSKRQRLRVAKSSPSDFPIRLKVQLFDCHPLALGAAGHAILAFLSKSDIERAFSEVPQAAIADVALPAFGDFVAGLDAVRANGYAFARGEYLSTETVGLAAPMFGPGCRVIGTLAIALPAAGFSEKMLEPIVHKCRRVTDSLSAMLGGASPNG